MINNPELYPGDLNPDDPSAPGNNEVQQQRFMTDGIGQLVALAQRLGIEPIGEPRRFTFMAFCGTNHGPKYEMLDLVQAVNERLTSQEATIDNDSVAISSLTERITTLTERIAQLTDPHHGA